MSLPSSVEQPARTSPETAAAAAIEATRREIVMPIVLSFRWSPCGVGLCAVGHQCFAAPRDPDGSGPDFFSSRRPQPPAAARHDGVSREQMRRPDALPGGGGRRRVHPREQGAMRGSGCRLRVVGEVSR
ncbi:hypothetical protein GCM10009832_30390 [Dietzia kunjamensis subsp. schimae]